MEVLKVFNNNVVLARDHDASEVVLTGRGLGYQARRGDPVDESRVAQRFRPDAEHDVQQLTAFLTEIPPEHLALRRSSMTRRTTWRRPSPRAW